MVFVLGGLALFLWLIAWRTKERGGRIFFFCAGLLNAVALILAVIEDSPYLYRLMPSDGVYERDYRRP